MAPDDKAASGHGAEDQEVVERLRLGALRRAVGLGQQRAGADEDEVPADARAGRRPTQKLRDRESRQVDRGAAPPAARRPAG